MRLLLTIAVGSPAVEGSAPRTHEVEVEASHGSTAADLRDALVQVLRGEVAHPDPTLSVAGRRVPDECPVGATPLVDGCALTLGAPGTRPTPRVHARTPVSLSVAHGPDAGRTAYLTPGQHTIGRSGTATIAVDDPGLSRVHAMVDVDVDHLEVSDLGSTNGTRIGTDAVGREPQVVRPGQRIHLGATTLVVRVRGTVPAVTEHRDDGTVAVNRRPRTTPTGADATISLPRRPAPPHRTGLPWVAVLLPLPVAGALALVFGPMMMAFAVMSPLMVLGSALTDRLGHRRRYAATLAEYRARSDAAAQRLAQSAAEETARLRRIHPDPAELLDIASTPSARLWERGRSDPDVLAVSVGTGTRPGSARVVRPEEDEGPTTSVLHDAPCVVPLAEVGVLGIAGPAALDVGRHVVGQLVTLHSPVDLDVVLLAAGPSAAAQDAWGWLARLPHLRTAHGQPRRSAVGLGPDSAGTRAAVTSLLREVDRRVTVPGPTGSPWVGRRTLLVLDGADDLRGLPGLVDLLVRGPQVGVVVMALAETVAALPAECRAVLDLVDRDHPRLHQPGPGVTDLLVDGVGPWWAERLSRSLAPLRDATPVDDADGPPRSVVLSDATARDLTDPQVVAAGWHARPRSTTAVIGARSGTDDPPMTVDLAEDGPHVLVAGTTGSGKSELLRTLVVSLAAVNRPEHLSFVLVDYKGGAAFRDCARLPHVAGVVTDLDDHLADRALTSLTAELKRREQLLARAGVSDLTAYQRLAGEHPPLARLVIVVDEFRALAEELPSFVEGMVRFAAQGRSLGVHVVLATQRPAGVVTADIKANVNLRIALRVRDRSESVDVLDRPDAALIDAGTPGRAYAASGDGVPVEFQTAMVAAPVAPARGVQVRLATLDGRDAPWPGDSGTSDGAGPTELQHVVAAVRAAAELVGAVPAAPAWLPALPDLLSAGDAVGLERGQAVVGLRDLPARQCQLPLVVDVAAPGHWGLVGSVGSGRTTALLTTVAALSAVLDVDSLHVYAVSGGSLAPLQALPHCGAHVAWDDLPRLARLVDRLSQEVSRRRRALTASGHPTMRAWWDAGSDAPPPMVVAIDDLDLLVQHTDLHDHGRLTDRLLGLLRDGTGVGLLALLAGERALLVGRASSCVSTRVLLRLTDPSIAVLAGMSTRDLPSHQPPGRGVLADGTEVQLALPTPLRGDAAAPLSHVPLRVDPLPGAVDEHQVQLADGALALGLGGDDCRPQGLDPARDGRRWLVCGPHGSGVSTALGLLARQLVRGGWEVVLVGGEPSLPAVHVLDATRTDELIALRTKVPRLAVLVDDTDRLADTAMEVVLREIGSRVERDRGLLVLGCEPQAVLTRLRGLPAEIAQHRTGVVLGTTSPSGVDLLGLRVEMVSSAPPGRGHVLRRGVAVPLQLALPASDDATAAGGSTRAS